MKQKNFTNEEVASLCKALAYLLQSGIPVADSLHMLSQEEKAPSLAQALTRMAEKTVNSAEIPSTSAWFEEEFKEFYALLSGGEQPSSYKDFIAPVFVMNAIKRSIESGKEEAVNTFEI